MGIDKKYRNRNVGYWICEYCVGLAQEVNKKVACALIILQTNKDKMSFYQRKCGFKHREKERYEGLIWMYRKLA